MGEPVRLFLSGVNIPIYTLGYLSVQYVPGFYSTLLANQKVVSPLFQIVDAISRGCALPGFLLRFRDLQSGGHFGRESLPGQFILGTLATSGGGLAYIWIFRNNPFSRPGWSLYVTMCIVVLVIGLIDSIGEAPSNFGIFVQTLAESLQVKHTFSVSELGFISTVLLSIGFLSAPTVAQLKAPGSSSKSPKKAPFSFSESAKKASPEKTAKKAKDTPEQPDTPSRPRRRATRGASYEESD